MLFILVRRSDFQSRVRLRPFSSDMKALSLLALILTGLPVFGAERPPNFIVIMVDDMGYAGVSCFGNPYFETPEIDRLAAEEMRLTDFHSSGTVCSPTRTGLLTGRYQQRAGIEAVIHPVSDHPEHRKGLQLSETTFAEVLGEYGYTTGLVGKWHQGYPRNSEDFHPQNHGFDEFIGYHSGNIDFISHVGDHYEHDWWHGRTETEEESYVTDLIDHHALDFVKRHGERPEPFCLYIAHEAIHNPVQVRGDPELRGNKASVYEGGHKVPAIAWWPGQIEAGSVSDQPLISIDVMPTLLALAGVETAGLDLDGMDLSPVLLDGEELLPRPLLLGLPQQWRSAVRGDARGRMEAGREASRGRARELSGREERRRGTPRGKLIR